MNEIKEYLRFAIFPPADLKDDFDFTESIARTPEDAWFKFCHPALNRKAYEEDGFRAMEVIVKFYVK